MDSLGGPREAPGRQVSTNWTACEAPGRQERTILDGLRGTRKAAGRQDRQPARHQGGTRGAGKDRLDTREAGKDQIDSLGGTREAPGTACKAPGRQVRTNWTAWVAPGRHQGGRK